MEKIIERQEAREERYQETFSLTSETCPKSDGEPRPKSLPEQVEEMVQVERKKIENWLGVKLTPEEIRELKTIVEVKLIFPGSKVIGVSSKRKRW